MMHDDLAADAGSLKSNVDDFRAIVDCSLIDRKRMNWHEDRTHGRGTDDAAINSSIAAQADGEFHHCL